MSLLLEISAQEYSSNSWRGFPLSGAYWPDPLPSTGATFNLYNSFRGEPDEALVVVVITIVRLNHLREEGILLREPCIELKYVKLRVTSNKA